MARVASGVFYRVRRVSDGLFLGNRKWGESYSVTGKFYATLGHARTALIGSGVGVAGHEFVQYEVVEVRGRRAEEVMKGLTL